MTIEQVDERSFARYELQTALMDGIFEDTKKIKNGHLYLRQIEKTYDHRGANGAVVKDAVHLKFRVPYMLNTQAESLLLAIVKLTGQGGLQIDPAQPSLLPYMMEPEEGAKTKEIGVAQTTEYALLKEAGMGTGRSGYDMMRLYLEQMSEIRIHYANKATGWRGSDWFLRHKRHEDGRLVVQLNWRLAGAVFGDYLFADIDLTERLSLKKGAAKTLHRWLSAHVWPGKSQHLLYTTLASHTWTAEATAKTAQKRIERLKKEILPELGRLHGWKIEIGAKGATISR